MWKTIVTTYIFMYSSNSFAPSLRSVNVIYRYVNIWHETTDPKSVPIKQRLLFSIFKWVFRSWLCKIILISVSQYLVMTFSPRDHKTPRLLQCSYDWRRYTLFKWRPMAVRLYTKLNRLAKVCGLIKLKAVEFRNIRNVNSKKQ